MARKRMIDPHIWEDPGFNALSLQARLLFIGMISNADDHGYLRADSGSLKRLIFGFDEITKNQIDKWIEELKELKNIHFYQVDNEWYAHLTKWDEYQKQREDRLQDSVYPLCVTCQSGDRQLPAKVKRSKEKLVIGGSRPKKNSIGEILEKYSPPGIPIASELKKSGISTEWQDKAFRYAKALNIELNDGLKSRWLKAFKQASEGRKTRNIDRAYSYLSDYPDPLTSDQKVLMFFKIYENGGFNQ